MKLFRLMICSVCAAAGIISTAIANTTNAADTQKLISLTHEVSTTFQDIHAVATSMADVDLSTLSAAQISYQSRDITCLTRLQNGTFDLILGLGTVSQAVVIDSNMRSRTDEAVAKDFIKSSLLDFGNLLDQVRTTSNDVLGTCHQNSAVVSEAQKVLTLIDEIDGKLGDMAGRAGIRPHN